MNMEATYMNKNTLGIPFGDAFGPGQLQTEDDDRCELSIILTLIAEHEGNEEAFKDAIAAEFFQGARDPQERGRLVALGVKDVGYQLVDKEFSFTTIGSRLYDLRRNESQLYEEFARHILLNLHGRQVIEVIKDLQAGGKKTTADTIKTALERRYGISIGETTNHWSQMRGWLHEAGIINVRTHHYKINTERMMEILNLNTDELDILESLTTEQRAFLRALAIIDPSEPIKNTQVRKVAANLHGSEIPQSKIVPNILEPLADANYIEYTVRRGAPSLIEPTADFTADVLSPLLAQLSERVDVPRDALRLRFSELASALDSQSTSKQRVALTALGVRLGRHLGLEYTGRRTAHYGEEHPSTDVIMDDTELTLTRWLIHCSANPTQVTPTQIASVTTTARLINANTILFVTQSSFREDAKRTAARIMKNEPYTLLTLSDQPNPAYDKEPARLVSDITNQLETIKRTKAIPDDGPFRGRDFTRMESAESEQQTVDAFDQDFAQYRETKNEDETKDLTEFTE